PKDTAQSVNEMVMGEVKRTFNPEFINRVDEIIIFDALTDEDLSRITRLLVDQLNANLKEKGITVSIKDDGIDWLLQKTLHDRSYGARPLRRAIQRHIEDALSEAFIRGQIRPPRRRPGPKTPPRWRASRWPTTSTSRARPCSSTSPRRRATATTSGGCATTSAGCGTRASWKTSSWTCRTRRRARSSPSGSRRGSAS